jgi:hypothetical protein
VPVKVPVQRCGGPIDARYNRGMVELASIPGGDLIAAGLRDLERGIHSVNGLLVAIGRPRLTALGFEVPPGPSHPEHLLYTLLAQDDQDSAHGRYNALIRRLVSFERSFACGS